MAVAFDKGSKSGAAWGSGTASMTQSHTHTPIGTPTIAWVVGHVWGGNLGSSNLTSITATYGGTAMTYSGHVGISENFDGSETNGNGYLLFFVLLNPPTGGGKTAAVSLTRSNTSQTINLDIMCITYTGVTAYTWAGTDYSHSSTDAVSSAFNSVVGDKMVGLISNASDVGGETPTDTIRYNGGDFGSAGTGGQFSYAFCVDKTAVASTTTFGFSGSSGTPWGLGVYDVTGSVLRTASLTGSGQLAATAKAKYQRGGNLAGAGALSGALTQRENRVGALAGAGSLTATATRYIPDVVGALSGHGQLSGVIQSVWPTLAGHGQLAATAVITASASGAVLSGHGQLSAQVSTAKATITGWWAVDF